MVVTVGIVGTVDMHIVSRILWSCNSGFCGLGGIKIWTGEF